jgi:chemotaxis protein CheZ
MGLAMLQETNAPPTDGAPGEPSPAQVRSMIQELVSVADYLSRLKREISALRANELTRDRIPMAHDELGGVVNATAAATNAIMQAAEGILSVPQDSFDAYRAGVEAHVNDIFEACAFQDITGQRISRVGEALGQLERRLTHFASAVNARDGAEEVDPEEAMRRARKEILMLNGPQKDGPETPQDAIDALFD